MTNLSKKLQASQTELDHLFNLYNEEQFEKAASIGEILAKEYPNTQLVFDVLGATYIALGNSDKIIENYRKLLRINPYHPDSYNNIGIVLYDTGNLIEAIENFKNAIKIEVNFVDAHYNLGNAFKQIGDLDKAVESYEFALSINSKDIDIMLNYANTLKDLGQFERAISYYFKILEKDPNYASAYNNIGIIFQDKGEFDAAEYYYKYAIKLMPEYATAYNNMGNILQENGSLNAAIEYFKKAIRIDQNYTAAFHNMGSTLQNLGKIDDAIKSYEHALKLNSKDQASLIQKIHQQSHICDWLEIDSGKKRIQKLGISDQYIEPFYFLPLEDAPKHHRARAEVFTKKKHRQTVLPLAPRPNTLPKRLKLGYFSSDFQQHPVGYLIAEVIETHSRDQFDVYGYSLGLAKQDKIRRRLIKGFDNFQDTHGMSDENIAMLARQHKIDIAIDLNGYTQNNRSGIFAYRAAPIQINYLGYPGTMGADFIDYIIADQNLIPCGHQKYFSEKPIYLPHHYQPQDNTIKIADNTMSRSDLGLPEEGFVFYALNNSYKITPSEFNIWMRLLGKVEKSVLWLLESNKWVKQNLQKEAIKRGVDPNRLIFAPRVSYEKYLSQFRHADLFLDTFTYNAGATASNALWAGLPVLTKIGTGYAARMAGSLLYSLDLPELITQSELEYEDLALELCLHPSRLFAIRQKLVVSRSTKPFFNTKLFTQHLENGYQQAYHNHFCGGKPKVIYVQTK